MLVFWSKIIVSRFDLTLSHDSQNLSQSQICTLANITFFSHFTYDYFSHSYHKVFLKYAICRHNYFLCVFIKSWWPLTLAPLQLKKRWNSVKHRKTSYINTFMHWKKKNNLSQFKGRVPRFKVQNTSFTFLKYGHLYHHT